DRPVAARHRRGGRRRHRGGQGRRRGGRRGPRERGRHHLRRQPGHARADGVDHPAQLGRHLRPDAGDHARPPRDPAHDAAQPRPDAHGVHDLGRRPGRRHHRDQRRRPRPHGAHAGRLRHRAVGADEARSRLPAALPRRRGAGPAGPHRGRGRPRPDGRADAGRRPGRGRQRRRHDEARTAAAALRRRAPAHAGLDRPARAPPAPHREPRGTGRRDPAAHPLRRLHRGRLPDLDRRLRAPRAGVRRPCGPRRRGPGPHPGPLRVPDRRRLREQPVRLRPAARRGARPDRLGGAGSGGLPPRPRGPGDRAAGEAAGLPAAGRRAGHRRRQPRPRPARRRAPLRCRDADPQGPRRAVGAAAHQQPGEGGGAGVLRGACRHARPVDAPPQRPQPGLPDDQAGPDGARPPRRPRGPDDRGRGRGRGGAV
ncbi:MAG: 3,4-dihydroxy-2-butanone 4-phosphate synthase / GTP cyclohydrolase II, partial [uncultured Nocardioidaceae bacterium]